MKRELTVKNVNDIMWKLAPFDETDDRFRQTMTELSMLYSEELIQKGYSQYKRLGTKELAAVRHDTRTINIQTDSEGSIQIQIDSEPSIAEEVKKLVGLATDRTGFLNIEHLRVLAQHAFNEHKAENKPNQYLSEFKNACRKAEGKQVNVTEHTKFSPNKTEAINIKSYNRTLPSDKNKKPDQMELTDFWKIKNEITEYIKAQHLASKDELELIRGIPEQIVNYSYPPISRKPNTLIRLALEYRAKLDGLIAQRKRGY